MSDDIEVLQLSLEVERMRRFEMKARGILGNLVLAASGQKRLVGSTLDVCIRDAQELLKDPALSPLVGE